MSGQVLIDGKPLKHGYIQFTPIGARPSGGQLDGEGRFVLSCFERGDGAVIGQHRVTIQGGEYRNDAETFWHAPREYGDNSTSGLTQEITGPTDSLTIQLTWNGKQPYLEVRPGVERYRPGREPKN